MSHVRFVLRLLREFTLVLLAIWLFAVPAPVGAQTIPTLASLTVQLWPEYDQAAVLVIYKGQLASQVSLPAAITLQLPPGVSGPNAVAYFDETAQGLFQLEYSVEQAETGARVHFETPQPRFQVEYYDFNLDRTGPERGFAYTWPGSYPVERLQIEVQQPFGAADMQLSPAAATTTLGSDNLTYYLVDVGGAALGAQVTLTARYTKTDDSLSIEAFARRGVSVPVATPAPTPEPAGRADPVVLALLIIGGVMLIGGGLVYWQFGGLKARRAGASRPGRVRRRKTGGAARRAAGEQESAARPEPPGGAPYCHRCGRRSQPGDRFCRQCGTALHPT